MTDNKSIVQDPDKIKDEKELEEYQRKTCEELKAVADRQQWVTDNMDRFPNEATKNFYQLPLNEEQREALFKILMEEEKKKKV